VLKKKKPYPMPESQHTIPFFPQAPIFDEVLRELREAKLGHPNFPEHICAKAAVVAEGAGQLITCALRQKYDHKMTPEQIEENKSQMREAAIYTAASAIRFIESL
jgi:hypothetical protein